MTVRSTDHPTVRSSLKQAPVFCPPRLLGPTQIRFAFDEYSKNPCSTKFGPDAAFTYFSGGCKSLLKSFCNRPIDPRTAFGNDDAG